MIGWPPPAHCYEFPPRGLNKEDAKRWHAFRRECIEHDRKSYEALRKSAHVIVQAAIRSGKLAKPSGKCADCDKPATCYDHRDYRAALVVDPVCIGCNNRRGRALPFPRLPRRVHKKRCDAGIKRNLRHSPPQLAAAE